jgi:hypothetical protein
MSMRSLLAYEKEREIRTKSGGSCLGLFPITLVRNYPSVIQKSWLGLSNKWKKYLGCGPTSLGPPCEAELNKRRNVKSLAPNYLLRGGQGTTKPDLNKWGEE